jgi:hypothetical protein
MSKRDERPESHRYRFVERWERKRAERSSKTMWTALLLDAILIAVILAMLYIGLRVWN